MWSPSRETPPTMWVGAAGTATAYGVCRAVRDRFGGQVRLISADTNPRHLVPAAALADEHVQVPPVADAAFVPFLRAQLAARGIDTYVPILDEEIVVGAELAGSPDLPALRDVSAPTLEVAGRCRDKLALAAWLLDVRLPAVPTEPIAEARFCPEGVFVKPRAGRGSVGARAVVSVEEFSGLRAHRELVVQPLLSAPEVTVDALRLRRGGVRAICRERLETKAGVCTKARVFEDDALAELARRLAEALPLVGAFCFQVLRTARGDWGITDVNPRPGAGTRMSGAAGVDILATWLADLWGFEPAPPPRLAQDRFVVRHYEEVVVT